MNNLQFPSIPHFVRHPHVNQGRKNRHLNALRAAMANATHYAVIGDSTRDNDFSDSIWYYNHMLAKAGITIIDNAASGQSGADWAASTDANNVTELVAAIPGDGTGVVCEFSYGINDVDAGGSQTPAELLALMGPGIDILLAAKPNITLFAVQPTALASEPRNIALNNFYDLLVSTYPMHLVKLYQPMRDIYDGTGALVYYEDATHPSRYGTFRAINYILSEILPDSLLNTVTLDTSYYSGFIETLVRAFDDTEIVSGQYWNSSGTRSNNASWASFNLLQAAGNQLLRIKHNGNRDDVRVIQDTVGNLINTLTVPDSVVGNVYEYLLAGTGTHVGINVSSVGGYTPVGDETAEVFDVVSVKGVNDLTQAEINAGLTLRLPMPALPVLTAAPVVISNTVPGPNRSTPKLVNQYI